MCILLVTTKHPSYSYIILNNRDEFLARPTAHAAWWHPPLSHVLGGRDLLRPVQGTWLGITRQGRIAVLTNFREDGDHVIQGVRSRGELPKMFLGVPPDSKETAQEFAGILVDEEGVTEVGGFNLVFGQLGRTEGKGEPADTKAQRPGRLGVVSNRMKDAKEVQWLEDGTWGLSNSHYGDRTWPKVVHGEELLDLTVKESSRTGETSDALIERCFNVLSTNTLIKWNAGDDWHTFVKELRHSIFIPRIGDADDQNSADELAAANKDTQVTASDGAYGTQKQTVILVDREGKVTFVERTLYDGQAKPTTSEERDRRFEFDIDGWKS